MKAGTKVILLGCAASLIVGPLVGLITGVGATMLFFAGSGGTGSGELTGLLGLGIGALIALLAGLLAMSAVASGARVYASKVPDDAPMLPILGKFAGLILALFLVYWGIGAIQDWRRNRPRELTNQQVIDALATGGKTWGQQSNLTRADVPAIVARIERDLKSMPEPLVRDLVKELVRLDDPSTDKLLEACIPHLPLAEEREAAAKLVFERKGALPRHELVLAILRLPAKSVDTFWPERDELAELASRKPEWLASMDPEKENPDRPDVLLALAAAYPKDPTGMLWEAMKRLPAKEAPGSYGPYLLRAAAKRSPERIALSIETYVSPDYDDKAQDKFRIAAEFVYDELESPTDELKQQLLPWIYHFLDSHGVTKREAEDPNAPSGVTRFKLSTHNVAAMTLTKWWPERYPAQPPRWGGPEEVKARQELRAKVAAHIKELEGK